MRQIKILFLFTIITINSFAQSKNGIDTKNKAENLLLNNLKKHIGYLASDALEGRRTGTSGEMKAVTYISEQYKKMGISPMGDHNTYIQTFEINEGKEIKKGTFLDADAQPLKLNEDYWPFSFSPSNVSFNGYAYYEGLKPQQPWLYDLKNILDSNRNNPHFDLLQHIHEQTKNAKGKGANALLVYNTSSINDGLEFSSRNKANTEVLPVFYLTTKGIKRIKEGTHINGCIELGDKIRKAHNVVAYIDNGAPTTVILGGHLDHLGYGEDHNSQYTGIPAIHNGADDNASGTSAVIELARILKEKSATASSFNKNNYCFINFSGEELGLHGSKYFTEHPTIDIRKTNYMINLDMIGRLSDSSRKLTVGGVGTSSTWGEVIDTNTKKQFVIKIDSSGTGPSDHESFYRKNIPVLFFFTGLHSDYHKPSDDANKINYIGETAIIDYVIDLIGKTNEKSKLVFSKTKEVNMNTGHRFKVSIGIMPDYTYSGQGVRADGIVEGKSAQKAGLKVGDIIIQLGEHPVTDLDTYMQALKHFNKEESTKIILKRGMEILEFPITF